MSENKKRKRPTQDDENNLSDSEDDLEYVRSKRDGKHYGNRKVKSNKECKDREKRYNHYDDGRYVNVYDDRHKHLTTTVCMRIDSRITQRGAITVILDIADEVVDKAIGER